MAIIKEKSKLMKMIKKSKKIFIMAHKNIDLDALGSSVGLYNILQTKKKEPRQAESQPDCHALRAFRHASDGTDEQCVHAQRYTERHPDA